MNKDNDFNESLNSESQNAGETEGQVAHDDSNAESMGEAAISAAKTTSKKLFGKKPKKDIDDEQDKKISELTNDLKRTRADFENFRRQAELQKEQYGNVVKYTTIKKVLPLLDDIERAIAANPDTLSPLAKNLEKTITGLGLTKIEAEPGMVFSPELHDAVMVEGDGDNEVIAEPLRTGYYYDGQVLRPTMVKVSKQ